LRSKSFLLITVVLVFFVIGSIISNHLLFSLVYFVRNGPQIRAKESSDYSLVEFYSRKNKLQGYVCGSEKSRALIVIAHGLGGKAASYIPEAQWFVARGYRVFMYDCTGTAASEGKGTMGTAQSAIDLAAALDYIKNDAALGELPLLLYGHSWGGYAAAAVLAKGYDITASVSISGYNTPGGVVYEQAKRIMGPLAALEYPFMMMENFFRFGGEASVSAVSAINAAGKPILIVHGTGDREIFFDGASIIARKNEITNPYAEYLVRDQEGRNGHNNLFLVGEYLDTEFMEQVEVFYKKYLNR
jgi:pimeloyl-ACP methyl ester carboxylesterase